MKVYVQWQDVKGSDPPIPLAARRNREGNAQTQAYYIQNNGYSSKGIDSYLRSLRAGHCFNFPGGHSYPFSAQMVTIGWLSRWLGLHPAAPVPPPPDVPAKNALNIGPLGKDTATPYGRSWRIDAPAIK